MSATFMEAWRRRAPIETDVGSLRPWLLGIATNVSRSHGRGGRASVAEVADHAEEIAGRLDDRRRIAATLTAPGSLRRPGRRRARHPRRNRRLPAAPGARQAAEAHRSRTDRLTRTNRQIKGDRDYVIRSVEVGNR